jgi:hypothetical protein
VVAFRRSLTMNQKKVRRDPRGHRVPILTQLVRQRGLPGKLAWVIAPILCAFPLTGSFPSRRTSATKVVFRAGTFFGMNYIFEAQYGPRMNLFTKLSSRHR